MENKIQLGYIQMDEYGTQSTMVENRVKKYLLPCSKVYGTEFANKINNVFKVAIGIGDMLLVRHNTIYDKHFFLLISNSVAPYHFIEFINWIKTQSIYQDDYVVGNIQKSGHHMIVIKFPEEHNMAINYFIQGSYSEMFTPEQVKEYFTLQYQLNDYKVITKDKVHRVGFVRRLNKLYNTQITPEEYFGELDFKPVLEEEVFNYNLK